MNLANIHYIVVILIPPPQTITVSLVRDKNKNPRLPLGSFSGNKFTQT